MSADIDQQRELVDELDGENRAVRSFLMQYSCDRSTTVGAMLAHMNRSGWRGLCPAWVLEVRPETHLTKGGAQNWIRHLFGLEARATTSPAPDAAPAERLSEWSKAPPTEQAWYWHWNGDEDCSPFPLSVLYSGTAKECFISMGQVDEGAVFCDVYGGYWMRIVEPATPAEIPAAPTVKASQ